MDGTGVSAPFLGVDRSLEGRRWRGRLEDERTALAIAQTHGLPDAIARVLAARGVGVDEAPGFLNPTLRDLLPNPSRLRDMDRAAGRLADAIANGDSVAVFGDYDVDGATSSALLRRYFDALGAPLRIYIPDRLAEGYGPNAVAMEKLRSEGIEVVVTVDCGILAFDALAAAKAAGLEVIVVDHHEAEPRLPPATAVVNPNRLDDDSGYGYLAAVGVAFLLIVALNRALRERGYFAGGTAEPDLTQWLDLVALGTICDVVPLVGVNRALAAQGLKIMGQWRNPGLAGLARVARLDGAPSAYHAGFLLGPRINAGGRVGAADLGARLLTTDEDAVAAELARRLDALNKERQEIEAATLADAVRQAEQAGETPVILAAEEGWHPGVIGIVASRLVDRFRRPACVVGYADGRGKGSGRSIPGVDLGAAVIAARQAGLLEDGGGHKMAAGFTVAADKIEALRTFLADRLSGSVQAAQTAASLGVDGILSVGAANRDLFDMVARAGPFGVGNPEPRFVLAETRVARADVVGGEHVRCFLTDGSGGRAKGIAFRAAGRPLGEALMNSGGRPLHLAGHLRADNWQGRRDAQFVIEDGIWSDAV